VNRHKAEKLLSAYIDRELSGEEMLELRKALRDNPYLQAEYESLKAVKTSLSQSANPEPPAELEDRLVASVLHKEPKRQLLGGLGVALASSVATAAAAFAILSLIGNTAPGQPNAQPEAVVDTDADLNYASGSDPFGSPVPVIPVGYGSND
jgi:anti-sigma factor RsiW